MDDIDTKIIEMVKLRTEIALRIEKLRKLHHLIAIDGVQEPDPFEKYLRRFGYLGRVAAKLLLKGRTDLVKEK